MRKEVVLSVLALLLVAGVFLFIINNMFGGSITGMVVDADNLDENLRAETSAKDYIVDINMFKFIPAELRIRVGDSVTWVNHDKAKHKIYTGISGDGSVLLDSGFLVQGASYTHIFNEAGVYEYWSAAWPYVQGTVFVEQPRS